MASSITSWVVLVYHVDHDAHAAHFPTLDHAEEFANVIRMSSTLCVSEPIPANPVAKLMSQALSDNED